MKRFALFLLAAMSLLCVGCKKENNKKVTLHLFHYKQEIVNEMEEMASAFHNLFCLQYYSNTVYMLVW